MFCPYKKYTFPDKDELEYVRNQVNSAKHNIGIYKHDDLIKKIFKSMGNFTLNSILTIDNLAYKLRFNPNAEFESKCDQLFNLARYSINQSLRTKSDTVMHLNPFTVLPINQIQKCSGYYDFLKSLAGLDTRFRVSPPETEKDTSDILYYSIKLNKMYVLDEYKP